MKSLFVMDSLNIFNSLHYLERAWTLINEHYKRGIMCLDECACLCVCVCVCVCVCAFKSAPKRALLF